MWGPNVLKAVYRRDDCLECDAVDYWAANAVSLMAVFLGQDRGASKGSKSAFERGAVQWTIGLYGKR